MLFSYLGPSFFSGIGVFVIAFVANLLIGLVLKDLNLEVMKRKDARMNHATEAFSNIKTLKLYSWTEIFEKEIARRREKEIGVYKRLAVWYSLVIGSLYFFPNVLSSVCFATYIGVGNEIDLSDAFTVLVFFELIKEPIR